MLQDYYVLALRFIRKSLLFSAINILGLSIGMACCLVIFFAIKYELSFDRHFNGYQNIYRLQTRINVPQKGLISLAGTVLPALPQLQHDYPNLIERYARVQTNMISLRKDDVVYAENVHFVDPDFFLIFKPKVKLGDLANAIKDPFSVILTESTAKKYFGDANPLGRSILAEGRQDLKVTGVIEDLPANTHFDIHFFISANSVEGLLGPDSAEHMNDWEPSESDFGYFKLKEGASIKDLDAHLQDFLERNAGEALKAFEYHLETIAVKDIHLHPGSDEPAPKRTSHIAFVIAGIILGIIVFFTACINFVNLSTARMSQRAREIGTRKALGASERQIVFQLLAETSLLVIFASVIAVLLAILTLPILGNFLGRQFGIDLNLGFQAVIFMTLMIVATTIAAGLYPALVLSRLPVPSALKGEHGTREGKNILSKLLIGIQFLLAIVLVIITLAGQGQLNLLKNVTLGYQQKSLWVLTPMKSDSLVFRFFEEIPQNYEMLRTELLKSPYISDVTGALNARIKGGIFNVRKPMQAANEKVGLNGNQVDYNYINVLGMKLIAGRNFSKEISSDVLQNGTGTAVITRSGALKLGYATPEEALGKRIILLGRGELEIIGVVDNVNAVGGYQDVKLDILVYSKAINSLIVKISDEHSSEALVFIEDTWHKFIPNYSLNRYPFSDIYALQRDVFEKLLGSFAAFALLTVVIACFGLYAIAHFISDRKSKEIVIRKVLGASRIDIVKIMLWEFSKPLWASFVVAIPIAVILGNWLLERFPNRVSIGAGSLFIAAALTVGLACGTVFRHTLKVASMNPVDRLHYD